MTRKIIGFSILFSPVLGVIIFSGYAIGWKEALVAVGLAVVTLSLAAVGAYIATG